jgi:hypothetical protein
MASVGVIVAIGTPTHAEAWDVSRPFIDRNGDGVDSLGVIQVQGNHDLGWVFSGEAEFSTPCQDSFGGICFGNADAGDVPVPGDYDADGGTDLAVYRPGHPSNWIVRAGYQNGGIYTTTPFGEASEHDVPVPADYDADGRTDVAVYRPGSPASTWFVSLSSGGFLTIPFGDSAHDDAPVPADFSCDGRADIAVRRVLPNGDTLFIARSTASGVVAQEAFGTTSDTYVPGDFDGDVCADLAVTRAMPNDNLGWFFDRSSAGFGFVEWGVKTDTPFPGDFNGDFLTDIGVDRVGTKGHGYVRNSATGALIDLGDFGDAGDLVINALYNQSFS